MMKLIGGGILIFIGLFMLLGVVAGGGDKSLAVDAVMSILFVVAPIGGGGMLIRSHFKRKRKALLDKQKTLQVEREKEVIRLAQQKGGHLSIPEIVAGTSMSTVEADQIMREMTEKGYVDMQVTDSGVIIYEFYEIAHRNQLEE
jgi:hypothetical protein